MPHHSLSSSKLCPLSAAAEQIFMSRQVILLTAFAAFVTGFRLAAGIACELKDEHYSFYDEAERISNP